MRPLAAKASASSSSARGTSTTRTNASRPKPSALARPGSNGTYQSPAAAPSNSASRSTWACSLISRNRSACSAREQAVHPEAAVVHQRAAEHVAVELAGVDLGHAAETGEGIVELGRPRRPPGPPVELGEGTVAQTDRLGRELGGAGRRRQRGQEVQRLERATGRGGPLRSGDDLGRGLGTVHGRHDTARRIASVRAVGPAPDG